VEDDAEGVPHAGADAAHTVAEVDAIIALGPLYRPVMDREGHRIALQKWYDLRAALHAWPLFGQDELAAREVLTGFREENRDLDRECEVAVEILVQAVEVTGNILQ
jgi:hypothetical protein